MNKRILIITILFQVVLFQKVNATINNIKTITINENSAVFLVQKDSILDKDYDLVKKLFDQKNYKKALKLGLDLYEKSKGTGTETEFRITHLIGTIYDYSEDYKKALQYFKKSLSGRIKIIDTKNLDLDTDFKYAQNLIKIGGAHQKLYIKDTLDSEKNRDSALYYYTKLGGLNTTNNDILGLKAKSYVNISGIYITNSNFDEAEKYSMRAIDIFEKKGDTISQAGALINLSLAYSKNNKNKLSKKYYLKAVPLLKNDTSAVGLKYKSSLYFNLSYTLYVLKDYEAVNYLKDAYDIRDKLRNIEYKKAIETINAEHNVEVAKKIVRKEEEAKRQKATLTAWIIGVTSLFIIAVLLFLVYFNKLKQKNLKLIQKQNIEKLKAESELQVLQASIEATSSERKRISQELHDGILGRLFGTRIGLGYLHCKGDETNKQQHDLFLEELQHIEKDIRDVSHKLSNNFDTDELTFFNVVNQLLKEKSYIGNFEFLFNNSKDLEWDSVSQQIKINLYRILQESLQNIIKHADAKKVVLNFSVDNKQLVVEIKDNGKGFSNKENSNGIGMKNIASRVKDINGTLKITSTKNEGSFIKILIPYQPM